MFSFPGQFEKSTDTRRYSLAHNVDNYNDPEQAEKFMQAQQDHQYQPKHESHKCDNHTGTLKQTKMPHSFDSLFFWLLGIALISVGYVTYSMCLGLNMRRFFLFLWNPSRLVNFPFDESIILLSTLLPWLGVAEICLRGIWLGLPQTIKQSALAFLFLSAALLFPLVLLWSLWQLDVIIKIGWSLVYLWTLWAQLYIIQSDV